MMNKNSINFKSAKQLPKGQRTHARWLKQAARKDAVISNPKH